MPAELVRYYRPDLDALRFFAFVGVFARLSYKFFERPFLLLKQRFAFMRSRPE